MTEKIIIPALGGTGGDVTLEEWLVKEGEVVRQGQVLFTVESDKAVVEVPAFRNGRIEKIMAKNGTEVAIGEAVALIGDATEMPPIPNAASVAAPKASVREGEPKSPAPAWTPKKQATEAVLEAYRKMVLIRRFEDHLYQLFLQGLVPGTLHQYQGQEAVAVGVCAALRNDDLIFSTHRPVGHFLAKGCSPRAIAAELWGKATGCAGGKGGQMHLCDMSVGAPPSNAIVGANIPIATGAALGFKLRGLDRVAVSFFGDGSANIGAAHEGFNLAAVKNAPVIFVCENNLYGASTHQSLATRIENIADRAAGYGMSGVVVDGMDVTAVYKAAAQAVSRARSGHGPTLLEYKTYRYAGHSRGDPGGYRTKDEIAHWKERDPIPQCRALLIKQHGVNAEQLDEIERRCQAEIEEAVQFAQASPDPPPESLYENVFASREDKR